MNRLWIVLLEAEGDGSGAPIGKDTFRDLMAAMARDQIVGLHNPYRYAIQLHIEAASPAEALFSAVVRWEDAVARLSLERWALQRTEVVTPEEFDRDRATAERQIDARPAGVVRHDAGGEGDELLRSVFYDSLTGLPTLALFRDQARRSLARSAGVGRSLALLLVDIDGIGRVNRDLGYVYGDQVLVELAGRLADLAGSSGAVARLAGDEFVLLVDAPASPAEGVAADLVDLVRAPIVVRGQSTTLTASVGMALVDPGHDLDEQLGRAGMAMCAAKDAGGDRYRRWESGLRVDEGRLDLVAHFVPDRLGYVMLLERAALAANECTSRKEAAAVILQQVLAATGWRAGHLWLVDRKGARLEPGGVWHVSGPDSLERFRWQAESRANASGQGLAGRALASGRPTWASLGGDEGLAGEARKAGLLGAVAFPVLSGSEVVAVLEFFSNSSICPEDSLLEVMVAVGAQLGRIFERANAAGELARSEERYRTLADSLPALIWATGPDARCTFVNRRKLEFSGRSFDQEMGHGWIEGVHPEDLARFMVAYLNAFARREQFELECRFRRVDGEYRWLLVQGSPVFEDGAFAGYVGGCIDVNDRHQAEALAHNEEIRFRTLVGNADIMIVVLDADGTVTDEYLPNSNLGYRPGEGHGRLGFDYVHPDDLPAVVTDFANASARPGPIGPVDLRVRHADGSWRWVRAKANNLLADPLVQGFVVTSIDVTEQKNLEERLRVAEERLSEAENQLAQSEHRLLWARMNARPRDPWEIVRADNAERIETTGSPKP